MLASIVLAAVAALLPLVAWAQPSPPLPPPRTTPAEIAAAMLPCVKPWGDSAYMTAETNFAVISHDGKIAVYFRRYSDAPPAEGYWYRVPDDPIQPPLTLHIIATGEGSVPRNAYLQYVDCLQAVYPPR